MKSLPFRAARPLLSLCLALLPGLAAAAPSIERIESSRAAGDAAPLRAAAMPAPLESPFAGAPAAPRSPEAAALPAPAAEVPARAAAADAPAAPGSPSAPRAAEPALLEKARAEIASLFSDAAHLREAGLTDQAQVDAALDRAGALPGRSLIYLQAPSAAGKSTLSRAIEKRLGARIKTFPVDRYFKDPAQMPLGAEGTPDFDRPDSLRLDRAARDIKTLLAGGRIELPFYDFKTSRDDSGEFLSLETDDVLVVDSIYATHPVLADAARGRPSVRIFLDAPASVRLKRRLKRDREERGVSVPFSLSLWGNILHDERQFINPLRAKADFHLGQTTPEEIAALPEEYARILAAEWERGEHPPEELSRLLKHRVAQSIEADRAAPADARDPLSAPLAALTARLDQVEDRYWASANGLALPRASGADPREIARVALADMRSRAGGEPPEGPFRRLSGWARHAAEELKEKIDLPGTARKLGELMATEGPLFAVYAVAWEVLEQVGVPALMAATGHSAWIPFALAVHLEWITYPAYFAARWLLRQRRLWRLAGGRKEHAALKSFRARLLNENPSRRVEKVSLEGFPAQSAHGVAAVNLNAPRVPEWAPSSVRALTEGPERGAGLPLSIAELKELAPPDVVRALWPRYGEHPRAVAYLLLQSVLLDGPRARARLVRNLAFKYWLDVGFDDMPPAALPFLDEPERALSERNRRFAGSFFRPDAPAEEVRQVKTLVADSYALTAAARASGLSGPALFDAVAAGLLGRERAAPSLAWARVDFLLEEMVGAGLLAEGDRPAFDGRSVAVVKDGGVHYADPSPVLAARARHRAALNGARRFMAKYRRAEPDVFSRPASEPKPLALRPDIAPAAEPSLLFKIHRLRKLVLPGVKSELVRLRREPRPGVSPGEARRARREALGLLARARKLEGVLEKTEVVWLKAYRQDHFVATEKDVPAYARIASQVDAIERAAEELRPTAGAGR